MRSGKDKAAQYRREAASCLQIAERMSVVEDRLRMTEMVQRWLELAKEAEEKEPK